MMYFLRLDDACEYMDLAKWQCMEGLLDRYKIKPLVGCIPKCKDPSIVRLGLNNEFWESTVHGWKEKGWKLAFHGTYHTYSPCGDKGINPYVRKSEFADLPLELQREKINVGYKTLLSYGVCPEVFFAPSHTFDHNTLHALYEETPIRIISDTIATDLYFENEFYFIPLNCSIVKNIPKWLLKMNTFCYHPNTMQVHDFEHLEKFLKINAKKFKEFDKDILKQRKRNSLDKLLKMAYFTIRKFRNIR